MAIVVVPTEGFIKDLKHLSKKHKGVLSDISKLSGELKLNPTMGTDLGQNVYKSGLQFRGQIRENLAVPES